MKKNSKNWLWGLFFLCAAGVILISQFGLFAGAFFEGISVFKIIVGILLIGMLIVSIYHAEFFGIFLALGLIYVLFAGHIGLPYISVWTMLAVVVFLSIGFHLIFGKRLHKFRHHSSEKMFEESAQTITDDSTCARVSFGASSKYLHVQGLKRARLECSFGALQVYFDETTLDPDGAVVEFNCSFAGVELYIPRTWQVINNINSSIGGVDLPRNMRDEYEGKLTLVGDLKFGGIEIVYV
ncbi:hypothetical protein LJC42_06400 [Eubacteriales bacterium OttesenSCG-928-K08]|nr:hypothetical protein [Eubacteriales bacterium OttesenSCG-928-K08]